MHKIILLLSMLGLSLSLGLPLSQPSSAAAAAPVKVEVLGMFTMPPMRTTTTTVKDTCQSFGDQCQYITHEEFTPDGQKFMQDQGLKGHIPMAAFINGSIAHKLGDRVVVFRDFLGQGWTADDLKEVIQLNLAGTNTAVLAPTNALTEAWNPGGIPPEAASFMAQGGNPSAQGGPALASSSSQAQRSPGISDWLPYALTGGPVVFLVVVVVLWWRSGKPKAAEGAEGR